LGYLWSIAGLFKEDNVEVVLVILLCVAGVVGVVVMVSK